MNGLQELAPNFVALPQEDKDFINRSYNRGQHLYIVLSESQNAVKIGIAGEPLDRLRYLQIGNPTELSLILVIPFGGLFLEKTLHDKFSTHNIQYEWFTYSQPIKDFVKEANELIDQTN